MVVRLFFFLQTLETSRVPTVEKQSNTARRTANFQCAPAVAQACRELPAARTTPCAAGDRRRARRCPGPGRASPSAPEREEKGRTGRPAATRAHGALCERPRTLTPRASTRLPGAHRPHTPGAQRAHPTRTTRFSGAQTRASGALSAHSRDATHASPLSHSLCDRYLVPGWAPFVSNHRLPAVYLERELDRQPASPS